MPLITVHTSICQSENSDLLLKSLSREIASLTCKPESYVMTILKTDIAMTFAGSKDPSAFVEIKSIGALSPKEFTPRITEILVKYLGLKANRIYVNFSDVESCNWGFNGNTFG